MTVAVIILIMPDKNDKKPMPRKQEKYKKKYYSNYVNMFFKEKAVKLPKYLLYEYVINLYEGKESFQDFFYPFLKKKFKVFKKFLKVAEKKG